MAPTTSKILVDRFLRLLEGLPPWLVLLVLVLSVPDLMLDNLLDSFTLPDRLIGLRGCFLTVSFLHFGRRYYLGFLGFVKLLVVQVWF